jgi:hypothetical protein
MYIYIFIHRNGSIAHRIRLCAADWVDFATGSIVFDVGMNETLPGSYVENFDSIAVLDVPFVVCNTWL